MARNSEHKRQAKLAKQKAKAKASALKQRKFAAHRALLEPYTGRKYQSNNFAPYTYAIETAIHEVDRLCKRRLTDDDVIAGLRRFIELIKRNDLATAVSQSGELSLTDDFAQMIADLAIYNLRDSDDELPDSGDLIGVARTLLNSADIWGSKNRGGRGYLEFLTGFMKQIGSGDKWGLATSDGDGPEHLDQNDDEDPVLVELLNQGQKWIDTQDEQSHTQFLKAMDSAVADGNGEIAATVCRRLLGQMPAKPICQELSRLAMAAENGQTLDLPSRGFKRIVGKLDQ